MSAAATTAQRQAAYRARKAAAGLSEVRGIFAHPDDHPPIKKAAARISAQRVKPRGPAAMKVNGK